ncbi:MAG: MgtC/SapB family protein [Clostridiales bacterium]|nr:MgtC/SapB family protein [Clostridiales bacterium]
MKEFLESVIHIQELWHGISLLLAALLGFCIGYERKLRAKEAGMRTHTVVCFGSALMMVISKYAFGDEVDTARVAAQIVAGVGFLGAGIIVYRKNEVHGLTTAAGVWVTAGIGMACGGGMYITAVLATVTLIFFQWLLHRDWKIFQPKKSFLIKIVFEQKSNEREKVKEIFGLDKYHSLIVERKDEKLIYQAKLYTDVEYTSTQIDEIMKENSFILSLERCDQN